VYPGVDSEQGATPINQSMQNSSLHATTTIVSTPVVLTYPPTTSSSSSSRPHPQPHQLHSSKEAAGTLLQPEGVESQYTFDEDPDGSLHGSEVELKSAVGSARRSLARKLSWASSELEKTTSIEYCIQLANFIKATSEAVQTLKDLP